MQHHSDYFCTCSFLLCYCARFKIKLSLSASRYCHSLLSVILFPFPLAHLIPLFFFVVVVNSLQERFQVKNPPHTYLQKLRSYLDPAVTRKVSGTADMLSLSHWPGCSTAAAFPSPLTFYLLSRISLQLKKYCTQGF